MLPDLEILWQNRIRPALMHRITQVGIRWTAKGLAFVGGAAYVHDDQVTAAALVVAAAICAGLDLLIHSKHFGPMIDLLKRYGGGNLPK